MAMTDAQLDALKNVYASGVKRTAYENKSVEYDDEAGLRRRMNEVKGEIAAASPSGKKAFCRLASYSSD